MNKPLRFSSKTHQLLWLSDAHMNHTPSWVDTPPLWKTRGFASIEEHDTWLKAKWHELVTPETIVFNLGDVVFSDPKGEAFRQFTLLPGRILALSGNHWSGFRQVYREAAKARGIEEHETIYPLTVNNLTFMGESMHAFIDGVSVYMTHYAQYIWPEMKAGGWSLVGHSHGRCVELNPEDTTHGKALDVGVDNAIRLTQTPFFTWDQVQRIMAKKPIVTHDHH